MKSSTAPSSGKASSPTQGQRPAQAPKQAEGQRPAGQNSFGQKLVRSFLEPLAYLTPFLIGLFIFTVYPFVNVIVISFKQDYQFLTDEFTSFGFKAYEKIFQDPNFINALKNTGLYVLWVVPIAIVISLFFANLLNQKIRFRRWFQTAYFLPMVTSVTAIGLVWKWLYNFDYGLINFVIKSLGGRAINWLNDPAWNFAALVIYGIWSMLPFTIILLLAGLQNVNPQYYTAAKVDGAGSFMIFRRVTLPLLAPTIGLTMIVNIISASKVFSELFPLFNGKPGAAYNLYTIVYYLFDQFYNKWQLDRAAASAVILFLIVGFFTLLQLLIQKKWNRV